MMRIVYLLMIAMILATSQAVIADENELQEAKIVGTWVDGKVVKPPYTKDYLQMQVGRVVYIIMEGAKAHQLVEADDGKIYEKPVKVSSIKAGDTVSLKANGNRVFQIIIVNKR